MSYHRVILEHPCSDPSYYNVTTNPCGLHPTIISSGYQAFLEGVIGQVANEDFGVCLLRPWGSYPWFDFWRFDDVGSPSGGPTHYRFDQYELLYAWDSGYITDFTNAIVALNLEGRLMIDIGAPHKVDDPYDLTYTNLGAYCAAHGIEIVFDASIQMPYDWTTGQNIIAALEDTYGIRCYMEGAGVPDKWYSHRPAFADYYGFRDHGKPGAASNRSVFQAGSDSIMWCHQDIVGDELDDAGRLALAKTALRGGHRVAVRQNTSTDADMEDLLYIHPTSARDRSGIPIRARNSQGTRGRSR